MPHTTRGLLGDPWAVATHWPAGPTYEATRPREVKLPEGTPLPGAVAAAA